MKITQVITEANIAPQILKDPKLTKQLNIAFRHDNTLPMSQIARLGPRPTEKQIVELWADVIDRSLSNTLYGDLASLNKFEPWLLKLYVNGIANYEDINGEGGDALGSWHSLNIRGLLQPVDQDFNRFRDIEQLQKSMGKYRDALNKIKNQTALEKHKRDRQEIVLIDNERYHVMIPLNYGSCYTFNNAVGVQAHFCTGGSAGLDWFKRYSDDGPIISVIDKSNIDNKDGKWQIHTATKQVVNAHQDERWNVLGNMRKFLTLFPGLFAKILAELYNKSAEIHELSKGITKGEGYDVSAELSRLQKEFAPAIEARQDEINQWFQDRAPR